MSAKQIQGFLEEAGVGKIKPSGENLIGTCPFHDDTHRSFSMNVETGQWLCFSESCGEQGGLVAFLVKGCGWSFDKAKELAGEWWQHAEGIGTEDGWDVDFPSWAERRRLPEERQQALDERLLGLYDFCPRYMTEERGFRREVLRRWEVGYDFETERVTFAVRDATGDLIGFSKRTTKKGEDPKYLHLGFKRSRVLYGEVFVPGTAEVWVTEGQVDCMALYQMGVTCPTSTLSAKVGRWQIRALSKYPRVVLAYDHDADGMVATLKVGDALMEMGHREVYVARTYPDGVKDPGDLLKKGDEAKRKFIGTLESYDLVRLDWP